MLHTLTIISILEVLAVTIPVLLTVAFITIAERKTMASMQRRLGPNTVGWYGLLQAFADALKLLLKEYVAPTQANIIMFFLGPIITLIFALLGYAVIPYGPGLVLLDFSLGILYMLAMSSLSTYGILLAGWSANSKYAFLGSLRSTAQLISYELILSSAILLIVMLAGSLDLTFIIESQRSMWYIGPLLPVFIIFFIGSIAETNRAPFDLAEAESELVSGFMTEHSAVIFVFFFLAEYASIVLICIVNSILFIGGYLLYSNDYLYSFFDLLNYMSEETFMYVFQEINLIMNFYRYPLIVEAITDGTILGIKGCIMIFTFIWARASFPRIRYDQLMSDCWTILLPSVISLIIMIPCVIYSIEIIPCNIPVLCDFDDVIDTSFYITLFEDLSPYSASVFTGFYFMIFLCLILIYLLSIIAIILKGNKLFNLKNIPFIGIFFSNLGRIRQNWIKILIICSIGVISRNIINDYYDVNVFKECYSIVSISYYLIFSIIIVFINQPSFGFNNIKFKLDNGETVFNLKNISFKCLIFSFLELIREYLPKILGVFFISLIFRLTINNDYSIFSSICYNIFSKDDFHLKFEFMDKFKLIINENIVENSHPLFSSDLYLYFGDIYHYCFGGDMVECSSSSAANEAFSKATESETLIKLKKIENPVLNPVPDFDFSTIDKLLSEMSENIKNIKNADNSLRIVDLQKAIDNDLANLHKQTTQIKLNYVARIKNLGSKCYIVYWDCNNPDLWDAFKKSIKESKAVAPKGELLQENPIQYWTDYIRYCNLNKNEQHHNMNIIKTYLKNDTIIPLEEKKYLIRSVKDMNIALTLTADSDVKVFKKNLENSQLIAELKKARGK